MKCPLCSEDVAENAVRCNRCEADLEAVRRFLSRIDDLEVRLQEVARDMDTVRARACMRSTSTEATSKSVGAADQATDTTLLSRRKTAAQGWWFAFLTPVAILAVLHPFLIVLLQASYKFLVVALIVVPAPFAFRYARSLEWPVGTLKLLMLGLATGLAAAAAMNTWIYLWEGSTPVPRGSGEWRQLTLTVLAIGLSSFAGGLLGRLLDEHARSAVRPPGNLAQLLGIFLFSNQRPRHRAQRLETLQKLVELWAAIVSLAASLLSAIGSS